MDQQKFTTIAHQNHEFYSPLFSEKVDRVLNLIPVTATDRVLDVGCGRAEMLIRLCERTQAQGIGVDLNDTFIKRAQHNAVNRVQPSQITWFAKPVEETAIEPKSLAAVLCIGATHAFGDYRQTLQKLGELVRPGGHILIGEAYWKGPPAQEYFQFLGASPDDYGTHADNIRTGMNAGLIPLYAVVSNEDEWDHYEGLYAGSVARYIYDNPNDPDVPTMKERISTWRDAYLQWGRAMLGFGLYLFLQP